MGSKEDLGSVLSEGRWFDNKLDRFRTQMSFGIGLSDNVDKRHRNQGVGRSLAKSSKCQWYKYPDETVKARKEWNVIK